MLHSIKLSAIDRGTVINVNGQIIAVEDANVSVFDRSFLFGDSLYEVIITYEGKPFRLQDHLVRLQKSATLCQLTLSQSLDEYEKQILKTIEAFQSQKASQSSKAKEDVYARIIVSRGAGKIGFGLSNLETPTLYAIIVEPLSLFPSRPFDQGLHLQVSKRMRNHPLALSPAMKSGNYLNNLLANLSAAQEGYDDALLPDFQGFITEGSNFNIFYVNRGIVATPPMDVGILDGISRRIILDLCVKMGIPCREIRFPKEYLYEADEVFSSSTTKEVSPVTKIDQKTIGNGKPGPITKKLKESFSSAVRSELNLS